MKKTFVLLLFLLFSPMSLSAYGSDVTRGQALSAMITTLDFPLVESQGFSSAGNNTPEGAIIQSAVSMGLVPAGNTSSAHETLTKGECLALVFQLIGWNHEAQLAGWLMPSDGVTPASWPYLALARVVTPTIPQQLLENPEALTSAEDLKELLTWLRQARFSVLWDQKLESHEGILWIHRESIGQPPSGWRVSLASFNNYNEAWDLSQKLSSKGPLDIVERDDFYHVVTPKVPTATMAALQSQSYPGSTVIPAEDDLQGALFWCAWSPSAPSSGSIVTAQQLGSQSLPLSRFAQHTNATAAINGGYFGGNKPIGTLFEGSLPLSDTHQNRSMVAWNAEEKVFFSFGAFRATVLIDGKPAGILRAINKPTPLGELGIYTPHFGPEPATAGVEGQALYVENSQIVSSETVNSAPSRFYRPEGFMLFNRSRNPIQQQGDVSLDIQWRDSELKAITTAIQGGPLLLKDHKSPRQNEGFGSTFFNRRHPRTLVGYDGQRLWWVVVDGRNSRHSVGLTLGEATMRGKQWGFESLLNLDGGGSSELIYRGRILNIPSDGRERKLPYALVFNGTRPTEIPEPEEPDLIDQLIRRLLGQ